MREVRPSLQMEIRFYLSHQRKVWDVRRLFYEIKSKSITQITHVKGAVMEPQWSPDGTKVLFSVITSGASQNASDASNAASASSSAASATQEQFVHDDDAVATEDFGYKFDGMGFIRPDTHWHLFAASADGTSETQLTDGEYDYLHAAWAPDSKKDRLRQQPFPQKTGRNWL